MARELIDIALQVCGETEKAYRVTDTTPDKAVWIPKSQCERNEDGTFTMPEWLAVEKGFV